MESVWTGSNLSDVQGARTNQVLDRGATDRARIGADATKMSAYFNLLANKSRTEAESHAKQAENARLYFTANLQDAQKKAELSQIASQNALKWGNEAKMAQDAQAAQAAQNTLQWGTQSQMAKDAQAAQALIAQGAQSSNERMDTARNASALEIARIKPLNPGVVEQQMRQTQSDREASQMAEAAVSQANLMLAVEEGQREVDSKAASEVGSYFSFPSTNEKNRKAALLKADLDRDRRVSLVQGKLGQLSSLVRYNPSTKQFESVISPVAVNKGVAVQPASQTPWVMPGQRGDPLDIASFFSRPGQASPQPVVPQNVQWIKTANGQLIRRP